MVQAPPALWAGPRHPSASSSLAGASPSPPFGRVQKQPLTSQGLSPAPSARLEAGPGVGLSGPWSIAAPLLAASAFWYRVLREHTAHLPGPGVIWEAEGREPKSVKEGRDGSQRDRHQLHPPPHPTPVPSGPASTPTPGTRVALCGAGSSHHLGMGQTRTQSSSPEASAPARPA